MLRLTEIRLPLDHTEEALREAVRERLGVAPEELVDFTVFRRSHDARRKSRIVLVYTVDATVADEAGVLGRPDGSPRITPTPAMDYHFPVRPPDAPCPRPIVIGFGPCGIFAALLLAEAGLRPIVLERGRPVRERTKETFAFWREGRLDPESNVQFGEGGAGTFSDGKLYSQIKDPGFRARKVLREFVDAGAPPEILYVAKPHIGTFKLVTMVERLRARIEALGGEVRFGARVDDFEIGDGRIRGLTLADGERIEATRVVLATGHSARDSFRRLFDRGVHIEAKPFSVGLRIEHPQSLIDRAMFGSFAGHPILGAADYKLVHHAANGCTAYSFCMCPGGTVVAAASEPEGVVTNGMSQYSRNERNANSALVVDVRPGRDFPDGPLAGVDFQRQLEHLAFEAGGGDYRAPVQRVADFLAGRPSTGPGAVAPSYAPGVRWTDLAPCLPAGVVATLREAIPAFDRRIRGFAMDDAVLTGVETRTSSPLRIPRGDDLQSIGTRGLFPAGEGAGHAGGILSAAVDGIRVAEAVALDLVGQDNP